MPRGLNHKQTPCPDDPEVLNVPCQVCGNQVQIAVPHEDNPLREQIESLGRKMAAHSGCLERRKQIAKANAILSRERDRLSAWDGVCPAEFRKVLNPDKRGYNQSRLNKVMAWQFGEMGLYLFGPTSRCKTRFTYHMLEREWRAERRVAAFMHGDLRRMITALAAGDSEKLAVFISDLLRADILFIDDVGKGRRTPAAEEALFALIDGRGRECRPTLFTANISQEEFAAQFGEEFQAPFLRRLQEKTTLISFK